MRDPERLDDFYDELKRIHKTYCPDWRFMQLICNFQHMFNSDGFYVEEDSFLDMISKMFGDDNERPRN